MNIQTKRLALVLVPAAVVLGLAVASWVRQAQAPATASTGNALLEKGMLIDASLEGLSDTDGAPMTEARLKGRYRLVSFGFTSCPDVCPTMLMGVHQGLEQLGADAKDLTPLFITVDPERDTPELLKTYTEAFDPRIVGLIGSQQALSNLARNYRMAAAKRPLSESPRENKSEDHGAHGKDHGAGHDEGHDEARDSYTIDHTAMIYLIDPQQRIRALIPAGVGPERVAQEIVEAYRAIRS